MQTNTCKIATCTVAASLACAMSTMAHASTAETKFPAKPIRMVVPYAPGGSTDILARILTLHMSENIGQQVLVDNRGGGATLPGTDLVAKAAPDGYTLLLANIALGANESLFKKLPYDTAKDLSPISVVATVPTLLVIHPSIPARSTKELIAYAKTKPGTLTYASAGNGSVNHLTMEVFKSMAGVDIVHVPYKGGAPAVMDTVAGQVSMMFATISVSVQHVKSGKLVVLGVSSAKRNPVVPDVPTINESGLPGFDVIEWQMLLAPAGTPSTVIDKLYKETAKTLTYSDVKERIAGIGSTPVGSTPKEASAFLKAELARWAKVVRQAGIKTVD